MTGPFLGRRVPHSALSLYRQCLNPRRFTTVTPLQAMPPKAKPKSQLEVDKDMEALGIANIFGRTTMPSPDDPAEDSQALMARLDPAFQVPKMHHLHIYSHRHNNHMTLTDPDRKPLLSKSSGNIGFRHASRGTYDAAYQLAAFFLGQIHELGLFGQIKRLEVVLRGYAIGREAITKALLGTEGRRIRPKITQVTDSTRLKFGGTRSKKPRRLG